MSKRVCNKKGRQRVTPARSKRTWLRHLAKKRWARLRELAENRRFMFGQEMDKVDLSEYER